MTDNTNTTPADDVLARARAAIEAHDENGYGDFLDRYATLVGIANIAPALVTALDAALARNRELEAQIARLREAGREMLHVMEYSETWMGATLEDESGNEAYAKFSTWRTLFADDAVSEWRDSSGNARHLTQADADARPVRADAADGETPIAEDAYWAGDEEIDDDTLVRCLKYARQFTTRAQLDVEYERLAHECHTLEGQIKELQRKLYHYGRLRYRVWLRTRFDFADAPDESEENAR